jgi:hypothetical protein
MEESRSARRPAGLIQQILTAAGTEPENQLPGFARSAYSTASAIAR